MRAAVESPIDIEVVDRDVRATGADERIEGLVFEEQRGADAILVAVVLADHAGLRRRIVRRPDAGQEHQVHIVDGISAEQDDSRRLLELLAVQHVGVGHAGDALAVGILQHLGDPRIRAQLEVRVAHGDRDHRDQRAALGVRLATEPLTIAAVLASAVFRAVWIGVGARRVG